MLTRLKVNGFKNLVDVDIRFGPFTCIAGANGVGKSNLFDAIRFLSSVSDKTLLDAASSVRAEGEKLPNVRDLFTRIGREHVKQMNFEAEMIVPHKVVDDLGKEGTAKTTFLRYELQLRYKEPDSLKPSYYGGELGIIKEELSYIQKGEALRNLLFNPKRAWRDTAIIGQSRNPFISTNYNKGLLSPLIKLHQDGSKGRPSEYPAESLPRTVLSSGNASESPTVLCARREMASWKLLQLEPSALRKPCDFNNPTQLSADGKYLASTLSHLARTANETGIAYDEDAVYCQISNRLSELIGRVDSLWVDRDEKRELFTIKLKESNGAEFPARALSDGTLRFLALAVIERDDRSGGVICLEEPENGIHPERIPAMLRLLQDIATDIEEPVVAGNPLRQIIVNTHSPSVVSEVPDDSLLVAETVDTFVNNSRGARVQFACLSDTWREDAPEKPPVISKGKLLAYLNPRSSSEIRPENINRSTSRKLRLPRKVRERKDLQLLLPFGDIRCS